MLTSGELCHNLAEFPVKEAPIGALANIYRTDAHGKPIKGAVAGPLVQRELKPGKGAGGKEAPARGNEAAASEKAASDEIRALKRTVAEMSVQAVADKATIARLTAELASLRGSTGATLSMRRPSIKRRKRA